MRWSVVAAAAVLLPAATLALRPTGSSDAALMAKARTIAANNKVADIAVDTAQSFRVLRGNQFKGLLVAGSGQLPRTDAGPVHACFIVAVAADGRSRFIPTIGADNWEAETCIGIKAVSLLRADRTGTQRLVLIYDAASPNAAAVEPVILRWSGRLDSTRIDEKASDQASQAGAETIAEVRKLLGL